MKILCINLDSRPDRWEKVQAEFDRIGLVVERFAACTGNNRVRAFNKSVYECMKSAGGEDLLIFEDDTAFDDKPFLGVPKDFMTLHLGANIIGTDTMQWEMPTKYNGHLAILHNAWQSHATLYSAECVKFIIDNFPFWKEEYEYEGCQIFDEWLRVNVLSMGRSYVLCPMIAYQRPDISDIWGGPQDYTSCHERGNKYLMNL